MSLKSFSFGLGLGIAFVSLLCLVLIRIEVNKAKIESPNQAEAVEMSDDEIIERAKELGMIFYTDLPSKKDADKEDEPDLKDTEPSEDNYDDNTVDLTDRRNQNEEDIIQDQDKSYNENDEEMIHFTIKPGAMAENVSSDLQKKGLIEDAEDFKNYLISNKYSTKVLTGEFDIPKGSDYDDIINIIVR